MIIKSRRDFLKIGLKSASALGTLGALGKLGQINAYAANPSPYRALFRCTHVDETVREIPLM